MNLESRFIDAGGINTHYYDVGSGPVMLLIHGGGAGADAYGNWRDCFPILSQHFRVIAPDMVGFGRSDKPSPDTYVYDQPGRNRHISDFIDAMGLDDVILVGNSMGGAAAIGATLIKPERTPKAYKKRQVGQPGANSKEVQDERNQKWNKKNNKSENKSKSKIVRICKHVVSPSFPTCSVFVTSMSTALIRILPWQPMAIAHLLKTPRGESLPHPGICTAVVPQWFP